jgi:putative ABC transport system permease protein
MLRKFFKKTPLAWLQMTREPTRLMIALAGIAFAVAIRRSSYQKSKQT